MPAEIRLPFRELDLGGARAPAPAHGLERGAGEDPQALGLEPRGDHRAELGIHRRHDPRHELDDRGLEAAAVERLGHLEPDEAAADYRGRRRPLGLEEARDAVHIGDCPEPEDVGRIRSLHRRRNGIAALREDELVVLEPALLDFGGGLAGACAERKANPLAGSVDLDRLAIDERLHAVAGVEALGRLQEQLRALGDVPRDEVREPAVREGDVGAPLDERYLGVLGDAPCPRGGRGPRGDSAYDDQSRAHASP